MNEQNARAVAAALGGTAHRTGGNVWAVRFDRVDGRVVVISDDLIYEYAGEPDINPVTATVRLK